MAEEEMDGSLLDLSDRGLTKLDIPGGDQITAVIADRNSITRIENLEEYPHIRQLSLKSNRLVHMNGVCKLQHLTVLNLPQNSIIAIDGLRELTDLTWLNLSGNSIKVMENLSYNVNLKHIDLSDNNIAQLGDIHHLSTLKTLLLHGNAISTLKMVPHFLPNSISIFSLAENEIIDINEVSFLSYLQHLDQVSIMNNPCVLMTASMPGFDYRPFVVNWCPGLEILDGEKVSNKEQLKAEWLYSQGKGHHFRVGQHVETIQYLSSVCPLTTSIERRRKRGKVKSLVTRLESAEDAKLSQILYKQKVHQQQLHEQRKVTQQWNIPAKQNSPQGGDISNVTETSPSQTSTNRQPVRAWSVHGDTSVSSGHSQHHGQQMNDLSVQDVQSEDYDRRSTSSLLDSESTYFPVEKSPTPNRPMTAPSVSMLSGPVTQNILDIVTRGDNRPATAIGDNKYDAYDRRPIKPLNQEMYKGLFKPDFNVSQPQISGTGPAVGAKKKVPPTAQAMDYDTSQDASQIDDLINPPKENVENIPTSELSIIKDAALKKTRKNSQKSKTGDINIKSTKTVDKRKERSDIGSHQVNSGGRTSIPVAKSSVSRTQSEYVPGRYSTSTRRPATTESVKSKTVKTIPEKVIHTNRLNGVRNDKKDVHNDSLGDSGFISRPTSDAVLAEDVKVAATKIQSFWRGYYTREYDVDAVRVRREIRARRAEEHIVVLRSELDKQRKLYEQEKQLRTLQLEAIRHLWKEVQSLQNWKNEVLHSQTFVSAETKREHEYNSYNSSLEIQNTLARAEMLNRMGDTLGGNTTVSSQYTLDTRKQQELEKTCATLQSQVSQLQQALNTVSSLVLQSTGGSIQGLQNTGGSLQGLTAPTPRPESSLDINSNAGKPEDLEELLVKGDFDEIEISDYDSLNDSHWGVVPHSLSPYPSEEEETYFKTVPHPGFPTPPRGLRLENRGKNALVLRWQPSKILDGEGREMNKPLLDLITSFPTLPRGLRLENRGKNALVLRWQPSKILDGEGREMNKPLLGYRVFVNDKPKAMIAGTKQKALIEGLDPTLTYKIYVKAVSDLGESNTSDIVMAALSKGSRRRSSSSDSNRSYDSDRESTSSERRQPHRKDSRKSQRKTKSPHPSKSERMDKKDSSQKSGQIERPMSKMEVEAEGIMTQPKLHTHRRTRSKDQNKVGEDLNNLKPKQTPSSPVQRAQKLSSQESQGFSFDERNKQENISDSQQNMSSTFTVDSQSSLLVAMSKNLDADVSDSKESGKGHRRRRSKDYKTEQRGDVSDSSSSVSSVPVILNDKTQNGRDSPSVHVRRSKDRDSAREDSDGGSFVRGDSKRGSNVKISPTAGSQGVPVIDGRRRHGSGSRPSSPAHSDISDSRSSVTTSDRRRMPIADLLEQRFSGRVNQSAGSNASSTATLTQSQADASASDLPPPIPRREGKYSSLENLSSRSSQDCNRSPTERFSPTSSERRRTNSTCSESDIVTSGSSAARHLDMDRKNSNTNNPNTGGIVAKLLQKLQTFSKSQEESLRTNKIKRKSGEPDEMPRKASGDSDCSDVVVPAPVHSDSSGAHSDDSQQVTRPSYRTHRRTSSDHRGILIKATDQRPPSPSHKSDHSPVIRESSKSSSSSSNNIKRHASFHGILPSKKEDLVRSGSTENLNEKGSTVNKQQNIDITVPTTPTRRNRPRSRSRSPASSSSSSHVPIISAAQLQKQSRASSTPPT